jgi:hypothetical protein
MEEWVTSTISTESSYGHSAHVFGFFFVARWKQTVLFWFFYSQSNFISSSSSKLTTLHWHIKQENLKNAKSFLKQASKLWIDTLPFTTISIKNWSLCVSFENTWCQQKADCPVWQHTNHSRWPPDISWDDSGRFAINHIWKKLEWRSRVNLVRKLSGIKWGSGAHTLRTACIELVLRTCLAKQRPR